MGWPFGTRKKQSAYEPGYASNSCIEALFNITSPEDKIQAKLSRTRQPGAFSTIDRGTQALAEQQKPQDVQNLAEEEEPPAPPSLLTLREVYKHYHVEDSIEPKDRDVAAYVQALDSERESAMTQAQVFQKNHDSLWAQVRSLRSSVRSVIAEKDPSSRAENLENMPAYIGRLLDRVQNQAEVIDQKVVQIVELNTESRNQKTIHAQQIKAQENTHILKQQELEEELEEERQAELRRKENAHKKAVATLEDAHKDAIARLDATIATLQSGLLTVGSRFQSLTDSDCKSRFGLIRTLVHSLGPSPPVIDAHGYGDLFDRAEFVRNTKGDHFMYLLDASIWRILFDGIFSSPFRVFGKQGEKFTSSWEQLFGAGEFHISIRLTILFNHGA